MAYVLGVAVLWRSSTFASGDSAVAHILMRQPSTTAITVVEPSDPLV